MDYGVINMINVGYDVVVSFNPKKISAQEVIDLLQPISWAFGGDVLRVRKTSITFIVGSHRRACSLRFAARKKLGIKLTDVEIRGAYPIY